MQRPSETLQATVGSIVGAIFVIMSAFGVTIPDGVEGSVIILVSWIAALVTWRYAKKQRSGDLQSAFDGRVIKGVEGGVPPKPAMAGH